MDKKALAGFILLAVVTDANCTTIMAVRSTAGDIYIGVDSLVSDPDVEQVSYACKIHITDNAVVAIAGIASWEDDRSDEQIDFEKLAISAFRGNTNFGSKVSRAENSIAGSTTRLAEIIATRNPRDFERRFDQQTSVVLLSANTRKGEVGFERSYFFTRRIGLRFVTDVKRITCPGDCTQKSVAVIGEQDTVRRLLNRKIGPAESAEVVIPRLIQEQARVTPKLVGGKISVLKVPHDGGTIWIEKGECK